MSWIHCTVPGRELVANGGKEALGLRRERLGTDCKECASGLLIER